MARTRTEHVFTVEGSGPFPMDMIRYDGAAPATETDSGIVLDPGLRRIVLIASAAPTVARWESYGWHVTAHIERRLR